MTRRELPHPEGVLIFNVGDPIGVTGGDGLTISLKPGEAFVAGVHLRPALSHAYGAQAGVHVHLPLTTLRRLLGVPMDELFDRIVRLEDVLWPAVRALGARLTEAPDGETRAELLDRALARRLAQTAPLDPGQLYALRALRLCPGREIADIARDVGWSSKHLRARVQDAVGIGPRSFRRLLRFKSLVASVPTTGAGPGWASLAADAGYYDQAHMIREFREFSGYTPRAYLAHREAEGGGLVES